MKHKVCILTGGSSGIGLAASLKLKEAGYRVYELSRRDSDVPGIFHISCDVTDPMQINHALNQVLEQEDHIDLLVNNAGFGIAGAIEFTDIEDARRQMDVNFFGMVNMNQAVIPIMRSQKYGRIITTSSVAGIFPLPFQAFYSASKAAINSYTMAAANELRPFGISLCTIQPGDMATGFTAARQKKIVGDDIYQGRISRNFHGIEKDETGGQSPEKAADLIVKLAEKNTVAPIYTVSLVYSLLCFLNRILPYRIINRLLYLLYAR